jgi:hypothetical protein
MPNTIEPHEHILGGFIDELAGHGYLTAFCENFRHMHARRDDDNLIRYWRIDKKPVSKADQERVEWWHHGYRAALKNWRPKDYS